MLYRICHVSIFFFCPPPPAPPDTNYSGTWETLSGLTSLWSMYKINCCRDRWLQATVGSLRSAYTVMRWAPTHAIGCLFFTTTLRLALPLIPKKGCFLLGFFFCTWEQEKEKETPLFFCLFALHASGGVCVCGCVCRWRAKEAGGGGVQQRMWQF